MLIKRSILVSAIIFARKLTNQNLYKELLDIYYKLLNQESITGNFINNFFFYENISQPALELLNIN